ncbi:MAG: hypothetical protein Q8N10_11585 [Phenylobacterium sp.]|uniref:hypothetical protein n=1 Tax=Phenylobacterium sp. TaxID=1871053 RepID=UPI0027257750|nr:hypothetical protein [Phenylobacterium sp.]MDO8912546.1 hypothetical protein [Phenylobacterium sp.]MDP3101129.1 hypothetical protein [Phenylobacterium sp.]
MILALLMSAALSGADQPAAATPQAIPVAAPLNKGEQRIKMVCRQEAPTGTRLAKRTCLSLEDWKRRSEEDQEAMRQMAMKSAFSDVRGR